LQLSQSNSENFRELQIDEFQLANDTPASHVAVDSRGEQLAVYSTDGFIEICSLHTGRKEVTIDAELSGLQCLSFSPDGSKLVALVQGLHAESRHNPSLHELSASTISLLTWLLPSGKAVPEKPLAVRREVSFARRPRETYPELEEWIDSKKSDEIIEQVAVSPNNQYVTAAIRIARPDSPGPGLDPSLRILRFWDARTGKHIADASCRNRTVRSLAFGSETESLAVVYEDGIIQLWDALTGQHFCDIQTNTRPMFATFVNNDSCLIIADETGRLSILKADNRSSDEIAVESAKLSYFQAEMQRSRGQNQLAEQAYRRSLNDFSRSLGDQQVWTARVKLRLGLLLSRGEDEDEYKEAIELLTSSLEVFMNRLAPLSWLRRDAANGLRDLYSPQKLDLPFQLASLDELVAETASLPKVAKQEETIPTEVFTEERSLNSLGRESPAGVAEAVRRAKVMDIHDTSMNADELNSNQLLVCGEYRLLGDDFKPAVDAIELAIERGGSQHFFFKSLGWANLRAKETAKSEMALGKSLVGYGIHHDDESNVVLKKLHSADVDIWTAAYLLRLITKEAYVAHWSRSSTSRDRGFGSFVWFYVGQLMEAEGDQHGAIEAYLSSVELGKDSNHHIKHWAAYRLLQLNGSN
jgi:hypothetical protein